MTVVKRVSRTQMISETGINCLGYSQPQKDRILIRDGLDDALHKKVLAHEVDHFVRGEEGPYLQYLIPALTTLGGAIISSGAQGQATAAQLAGQQQAQDFQRYMYDQSRADYAPWLQTGQDALNMQRSMVGLPSGGGSTGGTASRTPAPIGYGPDRTNAAGFPDPGPQYMFQEGGGWGYNSGGVYYDQSRPGVRQSGDSDRIDVQPDYRVSGEPSSATQAGAARGIEIDRSSGPAYGGGNSGDWMYGIDPSYNWTFNEAMRTNDFGASARGSLYGTQDWRQRETLGANLASREFQNIFNRLGTLSGVGSSAADTLTSAGVTTGANVGQNIAAGGDARASGYLNQGNIGTNTIQQLGQIGYDYYDSLNNPSNNPWSFPDYGADTIYDQFEYNPYRYDTTIGPPVS